MNVEPIYDLSGYLRIYAAPRPDRRYAIGGDVSGGGPEGDFSAAQVLDTTELKQVAVYHRRIDPGLFGRELVMLSWYYNEALLAVEMNNHGIATAQVIESMGYSNLYRRFQQDKLSESQGKFMGNTGWMTDKRSKRLGLNALKDHLRERSILLYDRLTLEELRAFAYLNDDAPSSMFGLGAATGHDDLVMALMIALQAAYQAGSPPGALATLHQTVADALMDDVRRGGFVDPELDAPSGDFFDEFD